MATWADRANAEVKRRGWSLAELARRAGVNEDALYKHLQGKVAQPRGETVAKYARALGLHEAWLRFGHGPRVASVPLVGFVGAGEEVVGPDTYPYNGGFDEVDVSLDATDPIALRVRGRSMIPVYRPGDELLCARVRGSDIESVVGLDCVVLTRDGASYVKQVRRGRSGRYVLRSYNPTVDDIEDVDLEWAAPIVMIRRAA